MDKLKFIILLIVKSISDLKKFLFFNNKEYYVFLLLFICWIFPLDLTYQNVKNMEASLKVDVRRNTPPLIALIDEGISTSFKVRKIQSPLLIPPFQKRNLLELAKAITSKRILHIKKPLLISSQIVETKSINARPFKTKPLEVMPLEAMPFKDSPLKVLHLKGITLSSVESLKLPHQKEVESHTIISQTQTLEQAVDDIIKPITLASTDQLSSFEKRWVAYEKEIEEERNKVSVGVSSLSEQNTSLASVGSSMPQQKWVGDVWVGLPNQKPSPKPKPLIISQKTNDIPGKSFSSFDKDIHSQESLIEYTSMISAGSMSSSNSTDNDLQERLMNLSSVKILGDITLLNGLGLLEGDELNVAYVDSCSIMREADIDLRNGRFSIDIEDPSSGFLRAQLRGENGLLRGVSQVSLRKFFRDRFLEDFNFTIRDDLEIDLQIMPFNHSSTMRVFNVGDDREPLKEVLIEIEDINKTTDNQGLFSIPEMLVGSSFIAKIHTGNLFKTLFLSTNDMTYDWETPSNSLIRLLQRDVSNLNLDLGIIWGRVLKDGKPFEGVTVDLAESHIRPYYLTEDNQFIARDTTTATGYFAYVNVTPGIQLLKGHSKEFTVPSRVLWTDRGYVSSVKLEETLRKEAEGCVFDSQTGDLLSAHLNYLGSDIEEMETQSGLLNLSFFEGVDPLYFELRANERGYYPMILTAHRNKDAIAFPVPSRAWIDELAARHKITQHPGLSMIVGYVSHSPFRVYSESVNERTEIVYFDREGSSQEPLPGLEVGGFVLFNIEPGLNSVLLQPLSEPSVAIKTVVTDRNFVGVFSHDF